MTNGEKFIETFPNMRITVCESYVQVMGENYEFNNTYPLDWWNAEYKEPTTKNNLGVDCISRADAIKAMQDKAKKLTNEDTINGLCGAVAILFDLPSVTPQEPKTGYWIDTCNLDGEYKPIYMCSNCRSCYTEEMKPIDMIFCPNCGCRMVEPQEREEN